MGIYIKGMEMPKNCYSCNFCQYYTEPNQGCYCVALFADLHRTNFVKERLANCPLVEVPTPHGRLIDADALKEKMKIVTRTAVQEIVEYDINAYKVDDTPTIIESEDD